ncbi:MAG: mechanosensitive ion channel [Pseudomonadales bacterium]|nr:mechanosensitive ion channel [Pseudomonadales bacterium]MCP5185228.1 mechanosensitive ion channel [Pseudomonadales bacterium]
MDNVVQVIGSQLSAWWQVLAEGLAATTSAEVLLQLLSIALCAASAWGLGGRAAQWCEAYFRHRQSQNVLRFDIGWREFLVLLFAVVLLWTAVAVLGQANVPNALVRVIANLLTVWAVIRSTSSTIRSRFWSRATAVTLWIVAVLNSFGWLGTVIAFMDAAAVDVGSVRISLLLIVKSLTAFILLFWAVGFLSTGLDRGFQRAPGLNPSQRVLFGKLARIALFIVAGLVGLNIVGLDLTALTVFSGALGLGIGFGLQKIFSNLISGIILLLDKSVKPGDVISVGDTYGWVNSLGARCVSVLTRDGKEHLIPNENLMAQQVENWSYSNKSVRVHVPVGVAYGSDVHQVREVLISAADGHPRILSQPRPVCLIKGFGDSSIDFELRVWIETPEDGISNVRSDLYYRIWDLFREHQIDIPFPQRDVHVKSDLAVSLRDAAGASTD